MGNIRPEQQRGFSPAPGPRDVSLSPFLLKLQKVTFLRFLTVLDGFAESAETGPRPVVNACARFYSRGCIPGMTFIPFYTREDSGLNNDSFTPFCKTGLKTGRCRTEYLALFRGAIVHSCFLTLPRGVLTLLIAKNNKLLLQY